MNTQPMMKSIEHLSLAIVAAVFHLQEVETELHTLEGRTCNGTIHWRPANDESAPMMYANHRHGQTCPLHGTPGINDRIRHYVGKKPERQAAVKAAMRLHHRALLLEHMRTQLTRALDHSARIDHLTLQLKACTR